MIFTPLYLDYMMEFTYLKIILAVLSCLTALINLIMFITSIIAMCFTKCCPTAPGPTNEQAVGQGDQPLDANPQLEEAFDNLPMVLIIVTTIFIWFVIDGLLIS